MTRRRIFLAGTASLALAGLSAACSKQDSKTASAGPAAAVDQGANATFVDALGTNPPHLNPQLSTDVATTQVCSSIYDCLVRIDSKFELQPSLATKWSSNADATEYTITLREGVQWHDGKPFSSADVKFNLENVLKLHPLGVQVATQIDNVEAPDPKTVVVKLKAPFAPFVEALSSHWMLASHLYEGTDIATNPVNAKPVGTGAFKFESFTPGDRVVVVRNDDYWAGKPGIGRIVFKVMPDANARVLALQSGDVDRISSVFLDTAAVPKLRTDDRFVLTTAPDLPQVMTMFFNTTRKPFDDAKFRHAIYSAIDRSAIANNAYGGMAKPARGGIPDSMQWAADASINFAKEYPFDAVAAGKALDEIGFPKKASGERLSLALHYASGIPTFASTAEIIKSNLEAIGVKVNLRATDLQVFVGEVFVKGEYDLAVMVFSAYQDPNLGVSRLYVCNSANKPFQNPTRLCDSKIDAAFKAAGAAGDRTARAAQMKIAEQRAGELLYTAPLVVSMPSAVVRRDRWVNVDQFASVLNYLWHPLKPKV